MRSGEIKIRGFVAKSEKAAVMKAVTATAGPETEARGICFSLPISSVMGLRSRVIDETE